MAEITNSGERGSDNLNLTDEERFAKVTARHHDVEMRIISNGFNLDDDDSSADEFQTEQNNNQNYQQNVFNAPEILEKIHAVSSDCQRQMTLLKKEVRSLEKFDIHSFVTLIENYQKSDLRPKNPEITKAIRRVRLAVSHLHHADPNVRKCAHKVLDSCRHSFQQLKNSVKPFMRALKNAACREDKDLAPPRKIDLVDGFYVEEIINLTQLIKLGAIFDNCVKEREKAKEYMQNVKNGFSALQLLLRNGEPIAMFNIDLCDREIREFDTVPGINRSDLKNTFPREVMNKILEVFEVSGDDVVEFIQCGAFKRFLHGEPEIEPVLCDGVEWWVYYFGNELIIGVDEDSDGRLYWSRFTKIVLDDNEFGFWENSSFNHLRVENLFEVVRRHPHLSKSMQVSLATDYVYTPERVNFGRPKMPMTRGAYVQLGDCIR